MSTPKVDATVVYALLDVLPRDGTEARDGAAGADKSFTYAFNELSSEARDAVKAASASALEALAATCESNGHLWEHEGCCIFCRIPKPDGEVSR